MLAIPLKKLLKELQFHSPFRHNFFPKYGYNFTVPQLMFLCESLAGTRDVAGSVVEIGCHNGATTVLFNRLMDDLAMRKPYYAIDTFAGFTAEDVQYEVANRGKRGDLFDGAFQVNSKRWFDGTMRQNGITRVEAIQADVNHVDLPALAPFSFVLLDVDLYKPTLNALPALYEGLTPGGMIVVDDCNEHDLRWDGADQAYKEFMQSMGQAPTIVHGKLGIVRKQ